MQRSRAEGASMNCAKPLTRFAASLLTTLSPLRGAREKKVIPD